MLERTNAAPIKEAAYFIRRMSADEKVKERARLEEKRLHDEASIIGTARRQGLREGYERGEKKGLEKGRNEGRIEGRNEGRIEGRNEGRIEILYKLIDEGLTEPVIIRLGYTEEEYKKALNEIIS